MTRSVSVESVDPLLTIPELHRLYKIGVHSLRRAAASGAFPIYGAGTNWPRARQSEFEDWLASTQIAVSGEDRT